MRTQRKWAEKHTGKKGIGPDIHLPRLAQLCNRHFLRLTSDLGTYGGAQLKDHQVNWPALRVPHQPVEVCFRVPEDAIHLWGESGASKESKSNESIGKNTVHESSQNRPGRKKTWGQAQEKRDGGRGSNKG